MNAQGEDDLEEQDMDVGEDMQGGSDIGTAEYDNMHAYEEYAENAMAEKERYMATQVHTVLPEFQEMEIGAVMSDDNPERETSSEASSEEQVPRVPTRTYGKHYACYYVLVDHLEAGRKRKENPTPSSSPGMNMCKLIEDDH